MPDEHAQWDGRTVTNDGRFPDETVVAVRYPLTPEGARDEWPWLPGVVLAQCGSDEWRISVEVRELATLDELGRDPAPDGTDDDRLYYPVCFRSSDELGAVAQAAAR